MTSHKKNFVFLAMLAAAGGAFAAQPAASKVAAKPAPPAKESERAIPYEDLGRYLGKRVIVYSVLGTVRTGNLTHYTQSQIDITIDGGAQLSFARDTIKSVDVPVAPDQGQGGDSAKKN